VWIAPDYWAGFPAWPGQCAISLSPAETQAERRRFAELLPEAIDLMSRGLRAGQALPATIETIARECDDPLRAEFRRAADEQSFGLPFREHAQPEPPHAGSGSSVPGHCNPCAEGNRRQSGANSR